MFVQNVFLSKFDIQYAHKFKRYIFILIKIHKDIEKKLCICYHLYSDIVAFYGHICKSRYTLCHSERRQHWAHARIINILIFRKKEKVNEQDKKILCHCTCSNDSSNSKEENIFCTRECFAHHNTIL